MEAVRKTGEYQIAREKYPPEEFATANPARGIRDDIRWHCADTPESLLRAFWNERLYEAREACVCQLEINFPKDELSPQTCADAEHIIETAWRKEGDTHTIGGKLVERLISWYVLGQQSEQALEFVFSILGGPHIHGVFPRLAYRAVRHTPELYWSPSVPGYLERALRRIDVRRAEDGKTVLDFYSDTEWADARRALVLICQAKDTSFLEHIADIEYRHRGGEVSSLSSCDETGFLSAEVRGTLAEACRRLHDAAHDEQTDADDFCVEFARVIKKKQNLKWLPRVNLSVPQSHGHPFVVALSVKPALVEGVTYDEKRHPDYRGVQEYLKFHRVFLHAQGAEVTACSFRCFPPYSRDVGFGTFDESGGCCLEVSAYTRSTIRMHLAVQDILGAEVVRVTRYIRRADN